jgi:hypothetical protein
MRRYGAALLNNDTDLDRNTELGRQHAPSFHCWEYAARVGTICRVNAPHSGPATSSADRSRQPHQQQVWVPREAGENRLALAALLDGLTVLLIGFVLSQRVFHATDGVLDLLSAFIPCALAVSFVNHVFGTLLLRGSLAKHLFGMRVLRWKDGSRPRFWQTLGRWLFGFVVVVFQFVLEGASVGQACGLRTVRRRDERPAAMH